MLAVHSWSRRDISCFSFELEVSLSQFSSYNGHTLLETYLLTTKGHGDSADIYHCCQCVDLLTVLLRSGIVCLGLSHGLKFLVLVLVSSSVVSVLVLRSVVLVSRFCGLGLALSLGLKFCGLGFGLELCGLGLEFSVLF